MRESGMSEIPGSAPNPNTQPVVTPPSDPSAPIKRKRGRPPGAKSAKKTEGAKPSGAKRARKSKAGTARAPRTVDQLMYQIGCPDKANPELIIWNDPMPLTARRKSGWRRELAAMAEGAPDLFKDVRVRIMAQKDEFTVATVNQPIVKVS